jgi:hypothetical protein
MLLATAVAVFWFNRRSWKLLQLVIRKAPRLWLSARRHCSKFKFGA